MQYLIHHKSLHHNVLSAKQNYNKAIKFKVFRNVLKKFGIFTSGKSMQC